jgi:hypothetical protein
MTKADLAVIHPGSEQYKRLNSSVCSVRHSKRKAAYARSPVSRDCPCLKAPAQLGRCSWSHHADAALVCITFMHLSSMLSVRSGRCVLICAPAVRADRWYLISGGADRCRTCSAAAIGLHVPLQRSTLSCPAQGSGPREGLAAFPGKSATVLSTRQPALKPFTLWSSFEICASLRVDRPCKLIP